MAEDPKPPAAAAAEPGAAELLSAADVEALLGGDDRATKVVYVPEWKRRVTLRQLTAAESIELSERSTKGNEGMLILVSMSVVDTDGRQLFPDWTRLRGRSAGAISLLQGEALKLNGFATNPALALALAASRKNA